MVDVLKVCYKSHFSDHGCSQQSKVSVEDEFVEQPLDGDMLLSASSAHVKKERRLDVQSSICGHKGKDLKRLEGRNAGDVLGIKANLNNIRSHCNFIDLTLDESDSAIDNDDNSETSNDSSGCDDCCDDEEGGDGRQCPSDLHDMHLPSRHQKRWLYLRKKSLLDDVDNEVNIMSDADDSDCTSSQDVLNEYVISVSSSTSSLSDHSDEHAEGAVSHDTYSSYENEVNGDIYVNSETEASSHNSEVSEESDICDESESIVGHFKSENRASQTEYSVNNEMGEHNAASTYYSKIIEKCNISPCKVLLSPCYDRPQGRPIAVPTRAKRNLTGYFYGENDVIESASQSEDEKPFELINSYMENDEEISLLSFSTEIERIDESDEEPHFSEFSLSKVDHIKLTGPSPMTRSKRSTGAMENRESFRHDQDTSNNATLFDNASEYDGISYFKNTSNICFKWVNDNTAEIEEKSDEIVSGHPLLLGVEKRSSRIVSDLNRGRILPDGKRMNFDFSPRTESGSQQPETERKKISCLWNNLPSSVIEGGCSAARKHSLGEESFCDSGKYELIEGYVNRTLQRKERIALSNSNEQVDITNDFGKDVIKLIKNCYVLLSRLDLNGYNRFQNTFIVNAKRKRKSTLFFDADGGRLWKKKKRKKPLKAVGNKQKKGKKKVKELFEASLRKINQRIRNQNLLNSLLYWEEAFDLGSIGNR